MDIHVVQNPEKPFRIFGWRYWIKRKNSIFASYRKIVVLQYA